MKKMIFIFLKAIGILLGVLLLYVLFAYLLPFIEISEKKTNDSKNIPIYIYTNGVHTDIVMPVKNDIKDWSEKISLKNLKSQKTDYKYVGIGWGDKGFYLDTPTWADLKFSTAFKAAFWLSESAMHCSFYNEMNEADDCKKIMISERQYRDLVKFVDAKFEKDANGNYIFIKTDAVYADNDAFYDANGTYSFAYTCNTWSNDALKAAGQKSAYWTASDYGIFLHYK